MNYNHEPNENGRQILNVGDKVMYFDGKCEVVHKHKDGLINLKQGWHLYFGVHPNQVEKIKNEN
jgi:hypothetical protein